MVRVKVNMYNSVVTAQPEYGLIPILVEMGRAELRLTKYETCFRQTEFIKPGPTQPCPFVLFLQRFFGSCVIQNFQKNLTLGFETLTNNIAKRHITY